jgi:hypothetical protein
VASLQIGTPPFVPADEIEQLAQDTTASCSICWRPATDEIRGTLLCGQCGSDVWNGDDGNFGFGPWLD